MFLIVGGGIIIGVALRYRESRVSIKQQKQVAKAKKAHKEIKDKTKAIPVPPSVPLVPAPNTTQSQGDIQSLDELPANTKLDIEITRLVGTGLERLVSAKGKISLKSTGRPKKLPKILFFLWQRGAQYYIDPTKIIKVIKTVKGKETVSYKLVYDIIFGEALNLDGSITWNDDLELILADSGLDQYVTIAAFEGGFQFTPTLIRALIIISLMGVFLGLALNATNHFIPTTQIHWVP